MLLLLEKYPRFIDRSTISKQTHLSERQTSSSPVPQKKENTWTVIVIGHALHTGGWWIGEQTGENLRSTSNQKFMSKVSNPRMCKSATAEGNSCFHLQTDRSYNKDTPYSDLYAFDYFGKKIPQPPKNVERNSFGEDFVHSPHTTLCKRRANLGAFQPTSFASITWHLAASCTCPVQRRSRQSVTDIGIFLADTRVARLEQSIIDNYRNVWQKIVGRSVRLCEI